MKKRDLLTKIFISLTSIIVLNACGLDTFNINERSRATIEGATALDQLVNNFGFDEFVAMDITTNETLANQGVERHQIDSVTVTSIVLSIPEESDGQDFNFIESLAFFADADDLERVKVAEIVDVPDDVSSLELNVTEAELADYAAKESMDIITEVNGRLPSETTIVDADVGLRIDVDISGVISGS